MSTSDMNTDALAHLVAIRAENKIMTRLLRKIKANQDDPDGSKVRVRSGEQPSVASLPSNSIVFQFDNEC